MYLELTPDREYWGVDIEADGLHPTRVWCVCVRNLVTNEERVLIQYEEIKQFFLEHVARRTRFIGHNLLAYDVPNLNRIVGTRIPNGLCVDTFILSSLYSPNLDGGHSLEAWGQRLGVHKGDHTDFDRLSDEMVEYCKQDVVVTLEIYRRLTQRMLKVGFSDRSCEIEHLAWANIQKQKKNGFQLNIEQGNILFSELREKERELREQIHELWPPMLQSVSEFKRAYKADGSHSAGYAKHLGQFPKIEIRPDGSYEAYDYVEFNLGSPKQRIDKLLEIGWEPVKYTKKGNPQVDEESLTDFALKSGKSEVAALAKWIVINSRANMIGNWLDLADNNGLVHGNLWLASTLRYRHDKPNTANIPAVRFDKGGNALVGEDGLWTYDSRDLWTTRAPNSRSLVGVDAKGIQLRILAEYIKDDAFTEAILSEDPHSANQQRMGLPSRTLTKTITYATLMGAGDQKIATEARISLSEAKEAKEKFFSQVPGLKRLVNKLKGELSRTGRITLCDGARVLVPSDHMVIPYLLQGDESRIMKQSGIYVDQKVRRKGLDVLKVGDVHDEFIFDVLNEHCGILSENILPNCFKKSGESFGYSVPIECTPMIGHSWAVVH